MKRNLLLLCAFSAATYPASGQTNQATQDANGQLLSPVAIRRAETVNAGDSANVKSDRSRSATGLSSGFPASFNLPAQNGTTVLYVGDFGFSITVPSGTTRLQVNMQASRDVDLFVNFGSEPVLDSSAPNAVRSDFRSITDFASESVTVPSPRAGTYYIAIGNFYRNSPAVTGTVTATLTGSPIVPSAQYTLGIAIGNAGGGSLPPVGKGRVELFSSDGTAVGTPQFASATGSVAFPNLATGSYLYRVYNTVGAFGTTEYWGEQRLTVSGNTSSTFVRNTAYVTGIALFNNATGQALKSTSVLTAGTMVRAEISIASSSGASASAQVRLDRDTATPFEIDQNCGSSSTRVSCTFVMPAAGSYSLAYLVTVGASTTDSGTWRPAFIVSAGEEALVTSAENLSDAAGYQRGNVSPGSMALLTASGLAAELRGCLSASTPVGPLADTLGGVSISLRAVSGRIFPAPLSNICNIDGRQSVTFQVPAEMQPEKVSLTLKAGPRSVTIPEITLGPVSPGVYSYADATGRPRALIYRDNGTMVTVGNPLRRGERARALAVGLGPCSPAVGSNQVASASSPSGIVNPIVVGLGNAGMNVVSALCSNTVVGLYEVTFEVGSDASRGEDVGFVVAVQVGGKFTFSTSWPTSVQ